MFYHYDALGRVRDEKEAVLSGGTVIQEEERVLYYSLDGHVIEEGGIGGEHQRDYV